MALEPQARHVLIRIVNQQDYVDFTYEPSVLHAHVGDTVTWICNDGPFAVEFKGQPPTYKVGTHGEQQGSHWESAALMIREGARGHYHYAVAVALANTQGALAGRIVLDAACPEIIVE
jgi:plastocyanin